MKKRIPKADSVLAFLQFKGWELVDQNKGQYILTPPKSDVEPSFKLYLPRWENEKPYFSVMFEILKDMAKLYDWELSSLVRLLSRNPDELDNFFKKAMDDEDKEQEIKEIMALAS